MAPKVNHAGERQPKMSFASLFPSPAWHLLDLSFFANLRAHSLITVPFWTSSPSFCCWLFASYPPLELDDDEDELALPLFLLKLLFCFQLLIWLAESRSTCDKGVEELVTFGKTTLQRPAYLRDWSSHRHHGIKDKTSLYRRRTASR